MAKLYLCHQHQVNQDYKQKNKMLQSTKQMG